MSSLHHEEILEDCYEQSYESFKKSNKLTEEMMQELILHSGVQFAIEKNARKLFESRCI
tara:strand:- start:308 stop:484 length:177 start_codon:yes stop_codon:yes gene_type:complete